MAKATPRVLISSSPPLGPDDVIYHYTSIGGLLGILDANANPAKPPQLRLWASNLNFLNDSSEFTLAFDLAVLALETKKKIPRKIVEGIKSELEKKKNSPGEQQQFFTCSVTTRSDDLSQWRGYGGNNGYAIGFKKDELEKYLHDNSKPFELKKCLYVSHPERWDQFEEEDPGKTISKRTNKLVNDLIKKTNPKDWQKIIDRGIGHLTYIKERSFKDEDEFRIISTIQFPGDKLKFREGHSNLIPYVEIELDYSLLKRIIVGPSPNINLAEQAIRLLKDSRSFLSKIEINHSQIPFRNW
ncbi:MAG: DUF2971 domain-containing protein [Candidatus Riflebacteria bacterium]|nr:DUF2971 domain-containing protein [Candidatus Riflebacteria bacterium]